MKISEKYRRLAEACVADNQQMRVSPSEFLVMLEEFKADVVSLTEENDGLRDELSDAQYAPWPQWASSILETLKSYGHDPVDVDGEVDLAAAFRDYLENIAQEDEAYSRSLALKDAEIERLHSELAAAKKHAAELQSLTEVSNGVR